MTTATIERTKLEAGARVSCTLDPSDWSTLAGRAVAANRGMEKEPETLHGSVSVVVNGATYPVLVRLDCGVARAYKFSELTPLVADEADKDGD